MFLAAQVFVTRFHHTGVMHPWIGFVFWVFFAALIGLAVWLFVRESHVVHAGPVPGPGSDPAVDMLRARFARGEIDANEFAARSAYLTGQGVPPVSAPEAPAPSSDNSPDES